MFYECNSIELLSFYCLKGIKIGEKNLIVILLINKGKTKTVSPLHNEFFEISIALITHVFFMFTIQYTSVFLDIIISITTHFIYPTKALCEL